MKIIYSFFVLIACLVCGCSYSAGPKNHYYKKNGQIWNTSKIYGYPNGKRTLAQIDTYKKQNNSKESSTYDLQESVLYYELWPNYEWKFVSKKGFTTYKNGKYLLNNDSLIVPDNVIYKYFDKDFIEHIEVYKDGKRIPYTAGYPDGHRSMQYMREQPGVYNWKDGKEYFERPFTEAEWGSHEKMNEYLNRKSASDKLKITQLIGDYYIFTTSKPINGNPFPSNGMYCVTDLGVVLFDTPWDTTQFQPLLDSIELRHNKKVLACIVTHFHDDRTAGLAYYRALGIKTYSSKQTSDLCLLRNEKQAEFNFIHDTTFTYGNHSFQTFYAGEGHTPDNIVIWLNDAKILYGGCLVKSTENSGLGNIADANLNAWSKTIQTIMNKYPNPNYVIPGHFGWSNNNGLQHTLKLLKQQ